ALADRKFVNVAGDQAARNIVDHERLLERRIIVIPNALSRAVGPALLPFVVGQVLGCRERYQKLQALAEAPVRAYGKRVIGTEAGGRLNRRDTVILRVRPQ